MNTSILIQNATLTDPCAVVSGTGDVLLQEGKIAAIHAQIDPALYPHAQVIDARGLCLTPGIIDMHVHLRDPGQTHKEDIITGTTAAAAGGITAVLCMPNTIPPCDSPETVQYIKQTAATANAHVYVTACITKGMAGAQLCNYPALKQAGAIAVSDDGKPVENPDLMRAGMVEAQKAGLLTISHCEDLSIIAGGIINQGVISKTLGVKGMDRASEDTITAREVRLALETGTKVHIAHVSTAGAVDIIRKGKEAGAPVTCETAPHYLLLTEDKLLAKNANYRMNPPLRTQADKEALLTGIVDGTIDAIATDHAPHSPAEKSDFLTAPNGVIGLETLLAGSITALVRTGYISLERLMALLSTNPAEILGVPGGKLAVGAVADLILMDPAKPWTVRGAEMQSKSQNTAFEGMELYGQVQCTILGGKIVYHK